MVFILSATSIEAASPTLGVVGCFEDRSESHGRIMLCRSYLTSAQKRRLKRA